MSADEGALLKIINHLAPNHTVIFNLDKKKITISNVRDTKIAHKEIIVDSLDGKRKILFSQLVCELMNQRVRNIILRDNRGSESTFMSVAELVSYLEKRTS